MQAQMLAPAAVLIAWSLVMLFMIPITRFPALAKLGINVSNAERGVRGQDSEDKLPPSVNWKSHNYTHLMEQPTIFYPAVVIIALMGAGAGDVLAAWIYVGLRVIHSLWQAFVNIVAVRFALFLAMTVALLFLAYRAVSLTLFADPGVA
ncbi:MAPEG family protein [Altererythrobacter arenosus]|uniref:MAPEG family protein n=1 Tax=Altererythrobacter arenosus TaxID=3032592 RepID=A0ABY8FR34_9SPHN|nr:MAPEG family protein [Altererythrobacter sp. CAU 1644]WFL77312.1 MAPEG family protein [Altererythrobacter sp. CAU 1644]